jgi:phenylalanyl-tRNA synthetase beta chain
MALRRQLVALGFFEARTLTLVGEDVAPAVPESRRVRNPLTADQVMLRAGLIPGLIETLANNVRGGTKSVRLFELGRVFREEERTQLALLMTGATAAGSWRDAKPRVADFFDLKGAIAALGFGELSYRPAQDPGLALLAEIFLGDARIGRAGQLWPAKAREIDVTTPVLVAEIDLSALDAAAPGKRLYREIAKYPAVTRDMALIVPLATTHAQIAEILQAASEPLLESVELFDVFTDPTGERVAAEKKSLAYSLTYRAADRTLILNEVNAAHARLKDRLKAGLDVVFRE